MLDTLSIPCYCKWMNEIKAFRRQVSYDRDGHPRISYVVDDRKREPIIDSRRSFVWGAVSGILGAAAIKAGIDVLASEDSAVRALFDAQVKAYNAELVRLQEETRRNLEEVESGGN